jgi:hypothetical protein
MSAQFSSKPSDMVQSMEVKISSFTQYLTQTEINNLALGKNNKIRLRHSGILNHISNSDLSSITPSIRVNPRYTILNQQSSGGAGIPQNTTYLYNNGTSVLIDPGSGSNFTIPTVVYIYSSSSNNSSLQSIANTILNFYLSANVNNPTPSPSELSSKNSWLPNQSGSGSSYWYYSSSDTDDFVCQQIILYAALYAYISTVILGKSVTQVSLSMKSNAVGSSYGGLHTGQGKTAGTFPYDLGYINFSTAWPLQLTSLSITTFAGIQPYQFTVPFNNRPDPGLLPALTDIISITDNGVLTLFGINLPISVGSNSSTVNNYSSNPTGIVSLTQSNSMVDMSIIAFGLTTVTINNVNFNVNSFPTFIGIMPLNNPNYPLFTSSEKLPYQPPSEPQRYYYSYGYWDVSIYFFILSVYCPYNIIFTSSNPNLPIVNGNGVPDPNGYYVYLKNENNINQPQESTITFTAYFNGQIIPNSSYSYTYTFNLQQPNDPHGVSF